MRKIKDSIHSELDDALSGSSGNENKMGWLVPKDFLSQVLIRPFRPEDQNPVKNIILNGLAEHWGWLDPRKNPDLDDVSVSFVDGLFLVAEFRGDIVGTGGLLPCGDSRAQIVRVHVAEHCRRMGLGSRIVNTLCERALALGYTRIILETTESWKGVISFYERNGFYITHYLDDNVYLAKQLDYRGILSK